MHLDSIADIEAGDTLEVGDLIGTVGDTGNAPIGIYHLHFEIRDEENVALDPYPRFTDSFTLKEKISFLRDILRSVDQDEDEYASFLVTHFADELTEAVEKGYAVPDEIESLLEDSPVFSERTAMADLMKLIEQIPLALNIELGIGDQGPAVQLMQLYLIYGSTGPARDQLVAAGPTGYFGAVTEAAVLEHQGTLGAEETGVYDGDTRQTIIRELAK
jgi:murein DD-endopeptidase MepM/ murein hydrolase activator NlpD